MPPCHASSRLIYKQVTLGSPVIQKTEDLSSPPRCPPCLLPALIIHGAVLVPALPPTKRDGSPTCTATLWRHRTTPSMPAATSIRAPPRRPCSSMPRGLR